MRLTLEKKLVLKNVRLFAGVHEPALSDFIAATKKSRPWKARTLSRGECGHTVYFLQGGAPAPRRQNGP